MTVKLMINTKTEMVSAFDERIIEERPWYVPYNEGDPIPQDPTVQHQGLVEHPTEEVVVTETVSVVEEVPVVEELAVAEEVATEEESADKPKRKNWKDAIAEKAQELSELEQAGDQPEASQ